MTQTVLVQKDGRRRPLTEEHKAKISAAKSGENHPFFGKTHTEESRAKISAAHTGKTLSDEHKAKISAALTGKDNPNFGKTRSEATRTKQSKSMTGRVFSEEHRAKMSVAATGKIVSEKTKAKISAAMTGENHHSWKGGISFEPYCPKFNNPLKEDYRNAYGRICGYCDKSELENGGRLSVHHIDGNKMQGCNDHEWFLVPLCRSCNSKGFERKPEYVFLFWLKDIERKHRGFLG